MDTAVQEKSEHEEYMEELRAVKSELRVDLVTLYFLIAATVIEALAGMWLMNASYSSAAFERNAVQPLLWGAGVGFGLAAVNAIRSSIFLVHYLLRRRFFTRLGLTSDIKKFLKKSRQKNTQLEVLSAP
jgi:hypothetical protein